MKRAWGFRPAALSSADSCAPFHWPMQLQPSTQSWRVICEREGSARKSASERLIGLSTRPPTSSFQPAKFCWRSET